MSNGIVIGEKYEGEYLNNQRHGNGILISSDGTRYEGLSV
jgi:hypothetical protein